jgi:hypothetical protein
MLAHKAVELDLTDSYSWCIRGRALIGLDVLGNAYLASFFSSFESYDELSKALKAYHQSVNMPRASGVGRPAKI